MRMNVVDENSNEKDIVSDLESEADLIMSIRKFGHALMVCC